MNPLVLPILVLGFAGGPASVSVARFDDLGDYETLRNRGQAPHISHRQTVAPPASGSQSPFPEYHARARGSIEEVLSTREFRDLGSDPWQFWRQIGDWLLKWLKPIRDRLHAAPDWLYWLLLGWMVVTLLAILGHLLYVVLVAVGLPGIGDPRVQPVGEGIFGIRELDFESVHAKANELLDRGEWFEAIKYCYVAGILWLDRQGRIGFHRSKTNADYLAELERFPADRFRFGRSTTLFETVVYGGEGATAERGTEMSSLLETMRGEVPHAQAI